MSKKFFWLKLQNDFFNREEIRIIEESENGKDYIIFYLKLLLKSIESEGKLFFGDTIPYSPDMLSSVTNTNIDTVKVAVDLFLRLGLMQKWDDGTLFMVETENMIGSETNWAKIKREKRRKLKNEVQQVSSKNPHRDGNKELLLEEWLRKKSKNKKDPASYYLYIKNNYEQGHVKIRDEFNAWKKFREIELAKEDLKEKCKKYLGKKILTTIGEKEIQDIQIKENNLVIIFTDGEIIPIPTDKLDQIKTLDEGVEQ